MSITFYSPIKRFADILVGVFGCIIAIPVLGVVKIVYLIKKDTAPIIFKQTRIGKGGKEFTMYKIRTMVANADEALAEILASNKKMREEYQCNKKFHNDPRVTKAGGFIRRYSIDELPQFFNILCSHMSFIGNRPYLPRERKDMGKYFDTIVSTKPGLISYWAIKGRNDLDFQTRLELESYYSEHSSFLLDCKIALSAPITVIKGRGAK